MKPHDSLFIKYGTWHYVENVNTTKGCITLNLHSKNISYEIDEKFANDDVKCVICPVCKKSIKFIKNEDINVTVERHMQSEQECSRTKNVVNRCPVKGCREILHIVNEFVCSSCKQKVCLKHRFERDHDCDRIYRSQLIPLGKPKSQILSSMIKKTATTTQKQQKMKLQQLAESCVRCGKLFPHRAARLAHRCSSSNNNAADTTTKSSCCVN